MQIWLRARKEGKSADPGESWEVQSRVQNANCTLPRPTPLVDPDYPQFGTLYPDLRVLGGSRLEGIKVRGFGQDAADSRTRGAACRERAVPSAR